MVFRGFLQESVAEPEGDGLADLCTPRHPPIVQKLHVELGCEVVVDLGSQEIVASDNDLVKSLERSDEFEL